MVSQTAEAVWVGPYSPEGGVTQSLLQKWLVCRERCRLRLVEGLTEQDTFREGLEYGNLFHTAEEAYGKGEDWKKAVVDYAMGLAKKYPLQQTAISKWVNVCVTQYEVYLDYWKGQKQLTRKKVEPLLREKQFCVEFPLDYDMGDDRVIYVRGKWDGVDLVGSGKGRGLALCENKAHGGMYYNPDKKASQLAFDFQTMIYIMALDTAAGHDYDIPDLPVRNIFYNVMKRPLTGGKGSIRPKQNESMNDFYARLKSVISEQPEEFFCRFDVELSNIDCYNFYTQCLKGVLKQFCDWWDFVSSPKGLADPFSSGINYRTPYGIFNPISAGLPTPYDTRLDEGSTTELVFDDNFYPELED